MSTTIDAYWYIDAYYYNTHRPELSTFIDWIKSQGGTFKLNSTCETLSAIIEFTNDSDAVLFVLKWGSK